MTFKVTILEDPAAKNTYSKLFPFADHIYSELPNIMDSDLLVLTGGSDVNPHLYGESKHDSTFIDESRDERDMRGYNIALTMDIPVVGICRGAQLACVLNGGALVQDVSNHRSCTHSIQTADNKTIDVAGDHHQMMLPLDSHYILEAWSPGFSKYYQAENGKDITNLLPYTSYEGKNTILEPEVLVWPSTKTLGVQYHPEWMKPNTAGYEYFQHLLHKYLL